MDNFFPDNSIINISDGIIEDISFTNGTYYVTIDYTDCINYQYKAVQKSSF